MTQEQLTAQLRTEFREFCVAYLAVDEINALFRQAGLKRSPLPSVLLLKSERRTLVERYYASLNWQNETDVATFLKVIGYALAPRGLPIVLRGKLRSLCARAGLVVEGNHVGRSA